MRAHCVQPTAVATYGATDIPVNVGENVIAMAENATATPSSPRRQVSCETRESEGRLEYSWNANHENSQLQLQVVTEITNPLLQGVSEMTKPVPQTPAVAVEAAFFTSLANESFDQKQSTSTAATTTATPVASASSIQYVHMPELDLSFAATGFEKTNHDAVSSGTDVDIYYKRIGFASKDNACPQRTEGSFYPLDDGLNPTAANASTATNVLDCMVTLSTLATATTNTSVCKSPIDAIFALPFLFAPLSVYIGPFRPLLVHGLCVLYIL